VCKIFLQLVAEVKRLKDINVMDKLLAFFSPQRVDLILGAVRQKKAASMYLNCIGKSSNMDMQCKLLNNEKYDGSIIYYDILPT
jgi:hypothetical protein